MMTAMRMVDGDVTTLCFDLFCSFSGRNVVHSVLLLRSICFRALVLPVVIMMKWLKCDTCTGILLKGIN